MFFFRRKSGTLKKERKKYSWKAGEGEKKKIEEL
jgi:hypothetical protein